MSTHSDITQLLQESRQGDRAALDRLMPLVYDELRRLAQSYLRKERPDHTLQPTALVHEAFLRLAGMDAQWENRVHFFAVAAQVMRRILVDHARRRGYAKRGKGARRVSLDEAINLSRERAPDLVAIDDALTSLSELDPRKCRIIELQYFGGLTYEETALALGISETTVHREVKMAKAWLYHELKKAASQEETGTKRETAREMTEQAK
ncbi:MAG: sigma-70 family RNA polymerase sigma factor [Acidobacteria bacterium]|nr:sigma-70 family RNA polymerase sigma factor [Acidobacteriota bacterium]MCW5967895.1 sigma-70 family RNA polymerase sigma factor [Blastocatellales bacterium]